MAQQRIRKNKYPLKQIGITKFKVSGTYNRNLRMLNIYASRKRRLNAWLRFLLLESLPFKYYIIGCYTGNNVNYKTLK